MVGVIKWATKSRVNLGSERDADIDMTSKDDTGIRLATMNALEVGWETHARRHTCMLCWNEGQSPLRQYDNGATCCLIRTRVRRFLITCAHVWSAFESFSSKRSNAHLWLSLVASDLPSAPAIPFKVRNPSLIAAHDGLDLATCAFDGIDSLEAWGFCNLGGTPAVRQGDIVHFLGYPVDGVRAGIPLLTLNYCFTSRTIHDVGHTQFILHDQHGTVHHTNRQRGSNPPFRAGGERGAPVFKVTTDFTLELVGIVSKLSSSGLTSGGATPHEMSDGDVYITHTSFIQPDGSITPP